MDSCFESIRLYFRSFKEVTLKGYSYDFWPISNYFTLDPDLYIYLNFFSSFSKCSLKIYSCSLKCSLCFSVIYLTSSYSIRSLSSKTISTLRCMFKKSARILNFHSSILLSFWDIRRSASRVRFIWNSDSYRYASNSRLNSFVNSSLIRSISTFKLVKLVFEGDFLLGERISLINATPPLGLESRLSRILVKLSFCDAVDIVGMFAFDVFFSRDESLL